MSRAKKTAAVQVAAATTPLASDQGDVVLVEYDPDGRVRSVITREGARSLTRWLLTDSKRDGMTYAEPAGEGESVDLHGYVVKDPPQRLWHVDGLALRGDGGLPVVALEDYAARGYVRIPSPLGPDPFDGLVVIGEGELERCNACDDYMSGDTLCRHLRWGDGGLVGPGTVDSGDEDVPESFKWVVRVVGCARALRRVLGGLGERRSFVMAPVIGCDSIDLKLAGKNFSRSANALHDREEPKGVDVREGIAWLLGLDKRTKAANRLALAWLDGEVAKQGARRASGERCYGVRSGGWGGRGGEVTARGLTWAEALAALRALPPEQRHPTGPRRASVVRIVRKPAKAKKAA